MSDDNVIEMNSFLADSVWHPNNCKRCGQAYEPKPMMGRTMYFPSCECNDIMVKEAQEEQERIAEEVQQAEKKAQLEKIKKLMMERMHKKYRDDIFSGKTDMGRIPQGVHSYIAAFRAGKYPKNMVLMGFSYSGKTYSIHYLFSQIGDPEFCCETPQEIFRNICDKKRSEAWYASIRWLCIDDIDKVTNDYIKMSIFDILDGRSKRGAPTFATTNQDEKTLAKNIGEPSKNRLFDMDKDGRPQAEIIVMARGK